jgi:hypothetical protein
MSEGKFNIDLISLDNINVISATLENQSGLKTVDHSGLDISFHYQLVPALSVRSRQVLVSAEYEIRAAKGENAPLAIASKYKISFLFSVTNLSDLAVLQDGELIDVDEEMLSSILNITYSTSRGILYTRYLGTVLEGIILPIIPTADLVKLSAIRPISTKK